MNKMNMFDRPLDRREFLKRTAQTAASGAALAAGASGLAAQDDQTEPAGTIRSRVLGKTGLKLPILGYGGAALPKAWFNPLSREERVELVRHAYDRRTSTCLSPHWGRGFPKDG